MTQAATSAENTLRKLGAHVRWLVEKSGVLPESCHVMIGVSNETDRALLTSTFKREFDKSCMTVHPNGHHTIRIHGVAVSIGVIKQDA